MSHMIMRETYSGDLTIEQVTERVCCVVQNSGDRYGTDRLRVPYTGVFDTFNDASKFIDDNDRYNYDGIAVKYRDYTKVADTKKIEELREKIRQTVQKQDQYIEEHSVKKLKAAYIGCPKCGSKLKKSWLHGEHCPLCRQDLRSKTTLDRICAFNKAVSKKSPTYRGWGMNCCKHSVILSFSFRCIFDTIC